jgi:hypothetical protein
MPPPRSSEASWWKRRILKVRPSAWLLVAILLVSSLVGVRYWSSYVRVRYYVYTTSGSSVPVRIDYMAADGSRVVLSTRTPWQSDWLTFRTGTGSDLHATLQTGQPAADATSAMCAVTFQHLVLSHGGLAASGSGTSECQISEPLG